MPDTFEDSLGQPDTAASVISQYADIKAQIKSLESQLELLKPEIEALVFDADGNKLDTPVGEFKVMYYPKWQYSAKLQADEALIKEKLKLMKHQEEANGTAQKITDGGRLVFTAKKG